MSLVCSIMHSALHRMRSGFFTSSLLMASLYSIHTLLFELIFILIWWWITKHRVVQSMVSTKTAKEISVFCFVVLNHSVRHWLMSMTMFFSFDYYRLCKQNRCGEKYKNVYRIQLKLRRSKRQPVIYKKKQQTNELNEKHKPNAR